MMMKLKGLETIQEHLFQRKPKGFLIIRSVGVISGKKLMAPFLLGNILYLQKYCFNCHL